MAPKGKKKRKKNNVMFERVYLFLTLVVVAGVAIFLGYIVGQYAIQAATGALDRELAREGEAVREKVVETARGTPLETSAKKEELSLPGETEEAAADESKGRDSSAISSISRGETTTTETVSPKPPVTTPSKQLYRVQVGAFSSADNAQNLAKALKDQGYPVLVTSGSLHRVQVGAFAERANAENLRVELEEKGYPAAIIATN